MWAAAIEGMKSMEEAIIHVFGCSLTFLTRKVSKVPEIPNPKRAVLMTREPKLDQLPIEKLRIMNSS